MAKSWPLTTISAPRQPPAMCYLSKCVCASGHPQVPASPKWAISCFVFFLSQQSNQVASLYKRWHFVFFFFLKVLSDIISFFQLLRQKAQQWIQSWIKICRLLQVRTMVTEANQSCTVCTVPCFFLDIKHVWFFISWYHTLLSPFKQTQPGVCYANTKPFPLSMSNQKSTLKT